MKKIYLTFDIDWAVEEAIEMCYDIIKNNNIKATFFATHDTVILEKLKKTKT